MSYHAALILATALTAVPSLAAADPTLPFGAALRLGDTRFRAGGPISELHFSQDGTEITSRVAIDDATIRTTLWDVGTGMPHAVTSETRRPGSRVRWSATSIPDSTRGIVIGSDGVPAVRDFAAEKDLGRLTGHFARVSAVTVSSDGKRIATGSADGFIRVWDAATLRPLAEPKGHTAAIRGLELSPDGRTVLTTGADRSARVWDLATGRELRAFAIPADSHPTFSADGAAVRIPHDHRTITRDLVNGLEITSNLPRASDPLAPLKMLLRYGGGCVALSPDGRVAAIGNRDGTIDLYELASLQVRRRLVGHGVGCLAAGFTPDGTRLLTASADHSVLIWPVRVRDVPLTAELKRETDAAKLWQLLTMGTGRESYPAMARLAADPSAALTMARRRLKPGAAANPIADARAVELLEAIGSVEARAFLRELAEDEVDATRFREARAALARLGDVRYSRDGVRTVGGMQP